MIHKFNVRQSIIFCRVIIFIILLVFGYLMMRDWNPHRWSRWDFGDIQTMLAVRNWQEEGFKKSHFLWIPQGYAKVTKLFDKPALQHHAHGIAFGLVDGKLKETRRIYTHYPSWYAVPYGLLGKLGIYHKAIYQNFAVILSFIGLFFLFSLLRINFGTLFALLCICRYLFFPHFLNYADSLANIALEDFVRFSFCYLWYLYLEAPSKQKLIGCFLIYFISCLTSLDSMVFIPLFAISYAWLFKRSFSILIYALLGIAPILAIGLSFSQNVSYLGLETAIRDWKEAFALHSTHVNEKNVLLIRFENILTLVRSAFGLTWIWIVAVIGSWLYVGLNYYKKSFDSLAKLCFCFFIAGIGIVLVFPNKGLMAYQPRQLYPVVSIIYATLILSLMAGFSWFLSHKREFLNARYIVTSIFGLALILGGKVFYTDPFKESLTRTFSHFPSDKAYQFYKNIGDQYPNETVVFHIGKLPTKPINNFFGHDQVHPIYEYLTDAPVLAFPNVDSFQKDLAYLKIHHKDHMNKIVVLNKVYLEKWNNQPYSSEWELLSQSPTPDYLTFISRN